MSCLNQTLKDAAFMFIHTNGGARGHDFKTMREASKEALAFIAGTGLDVMLQSYGLEYDAQKIRAIFYERFHIK